MSDPAFDPERAMAEAMGQAGQLANLLMATAAAGPPRKIYCRIPWERVNELSVGDGWELTAVMSGGLHVMVREYSVADEAAQVMGGPG